MTRPLGSHKTWFWPSFKLRMIRFHTNLQPEEVITLQLHHITLIQGLIQINLQVGFGKFGDQASNFPLESWPLYPISYSLLILYSIPKLNWNLNVKPKSFFFFNALTQEQKWRLTTIHMWLDTELGTLINTIWVLTNLNIKFLGRFGWDTQVQGGDSRYENIQTNSLREKVNTVVGWYLNILKLQGL